MRKHAEMIKAWADNEDLVAFVKICGDWGRVNYPVWKPDSEYLVCLPQHAEECEHWLNGGSIEAEILLGMGSKWVDVVDYTDGCQEWCAEHFLMCKSGNYRIKAKKEKYWIAKMKGKNILASNGMYATLNEAKVVCGDCDFYEIEVEA